jgi:hypothetical protein
LYSGFQIVRLQLEDKDFDGAKRTLDILRPFAAPREIRAYEANLAAAQNDPSSYLAVVRELCCDLNANPAVLTRAVDAVRRDWRRHLERALKAVIVGPTWNPGTPALWVRVRAQRNVFGGPLTYRWLVKLGDPGKTAVDELLVQIGAAARRAPAMSLQLTLHLLLLRFFCKPWRSDDRHWGQFGYALTCVRRSRWAVRWLSDWPSRSNLEPWMLQNLISSLLTLRRGARARAVLRAVAQTMATKMEIGVILSLWGVIGACIDDDLPRAERLLYEVPRDRVSDAQRALWELAATLVDVCRDPRTPATLTPERRRRLEWTSNELRPITDSGYLARLAVLKAARHARAPWRTLQAWIALHPWVLVIVPIAAFYVLALLSS